MNFGELLPKVYKLLEDPGQFAWDNSDVAFQLNEAVRNVANKVGNADGRVELNLVQGTAEYLLPQGVRRINNVRILPAIQAGGSQADAGPPLEQVDLAEFPVVSVQEAEPLKYSLSMVQGVNENQFQLTFYPTPNRSATGAIIVNIGNEYEFTSNNPADGTDLAQIIPFPPQYNKVIVRLTASGLLADRVDENDIRRGEFLLSKAMEELEPMLPVKSTQSYAHRPRAFP